MLRSRDRAGAEQELWALLTVYQTIRMAMTAAAGSVPGTDPDRASFTAALQTARDQVTAARGITDSGDPSGIGRIGRAVLDSLLPARRARYSARKVKCATSRYLNRDDGRPQQSTVITHVEITILVPPPDRPAARSRARKKDPPGPRAASPSRIPEETRSPRSWPLRRDATGPDANSPASSASAPRSCSPSSPHGPASASSPRPGPDGTRLLLPVQPGRNPDVIPTG